MDATNRTLSESELLPAAIAMTVTDLMAAGFMIVIAVLLKGENTLIPCHSYSVVLSSPIIFATACSTIIEWMHILTGEYCLPPYTCMARYS